MTGENVKKNPTIALNKHEKTNYSFNDFKRRKIALFSVNKLSAILRGITSKKYGDF